MDKTNFPLITPEAFNSLATERDWIGAWVGGTVTNIGWGTATTELKISDNLLREGGTVAGPVLMGIADVAFYAAVMSAYEDGRKSVTADMTMHFLRRPAGSILRGTAEIVKFGRRLAVGRVELFMNDDPRPVTHVSGSYALP